MDSRELLISLVGMLLIMTAAWGALLRLGRVTVLPFEAARREWLLAAGLMAAIVLALAVFVPLVGWLALVPLLGLLLVLIPLAVRSVRRSMRLSEQTPEHLAELERRATFLRSRVAVAVILVGVIAELAWLGWGWQLASQLLP